MNWVFSTHSIQVHVGLISDPLRKSSMPFSQLRKSESLGFSTIESKLEIEKHIVRSGGLGFVALRGARVAGLRILGRGQSGPAIGKGVGRRTATGGWGCSSGSRGEE